MMKCYSSRKGFVYDAVMYTRPNVRIEEVSFDNIDGNTLYVSPMICGSLPTDICVFGSVNATDVFCKRLEALNLIGKVESPLGWKPCLLPKSILIFCSEYYTGRHFWNDSRLKVSEEWDF